MIQRIQTLYLLVAEVLIAIIFFSKLVSFTTTDGHEMVLKYTGVYQINQGVLEKISSTWAMVVVLAIAAAVGFFVIFLYRRRIFQIRVCFFAMILNFVLFLLIGYHIYSIATVGNSSITLSLVDVFPIMTLVLYYMAYRGIAKDEAMVVASSFRSRR